MRSCATPTRPSGQFLSVVHDPPPGEPVPGADPRIATRRAASFDPRGAMTAAGWVSTRLADPSNERLAAILALGQQTIWRRRCRPLSGRSTIRHAAYELGATGPGAAEAVPARYGLIGHPPKPVAAAARDALARIRP